MQEMPYLLAALC